jgi:hypothetical protein
MCRISPSDGRGALEIQDPVDNVADLAYAAEWVEGSHALVGRRIVHAGPDHLERDRVDTQPRAAYSIANDRVTATNPPLVREASAEGFVLSTWSTNLVLMLTMWPAPWVSVGWMARWVMWKNPARFSAVITHPTR